MHLDDVSRKGKLLLEVWWKVIDTQMRPWFWIYTSKVNLALPKLVFCFCQKLSGLMMRATQISAGKASCRVFSNGLISSHLDPRISIITVNPLLHTSSLKESKREISLNSQYAFYKECWRYYCIINITCILIQCFIIFLFLDFFSYVFCNNAKVLHFFTELNNV